MTVRTMLSAIRYEVSDGVATITLDRPDVLNAFNAAMMNELLDAFDRVDSDDDVRAVVVTGHGRAFCAGADLEEGFGVGGGEGDAFRDRGGRLVLRILDCCKPVIAVVNGAAAGVGATMLLPMDVRIACESARFIFPYARIGMVPEGCSSWFLPRLVGVARALEWTFWGEPVPAETACEAGLVHSVLPHDEAMAFALARAHALVRTTSPLSIALTRKLMWDGLASSSPLAMHLEESRLVAARRGSPDVAEGIAAFRERRHPRFPQRVGEELDPLLNRNVITDVRT